MTFHLSLPLVFHRRNIPWCILSSTSTHHPPSSIASSVLGALYTARDHSCNPEVRSVDELVTLAWDDASKAGMIILNDPEHFNAIDGALSRDLAKAVEHAKAVPHADRFVLQGAGPHFCVGGNPHGKHVQVGVAANAGSLFMASLCCCKVRELRCPLIAAVHGHLAGGGIALCLNATCSSVSDLSATFEHGNLPRGVEPLHPHCAHVYG